MAESRESVRDGTPDRPNASSDFQPIVSWAKFFSLSLSQATTQVIYLLTKGGMMEKAFTADAPAPCSSRQESAPSDTSRIGGSRKPIAR
jgi:hypothetical protein